MHFKLFRAPLNPLYLPILTPPHTVPHLVTVTFLSDDTFPSLLPTFATALITSIPDAISPKTTCFPLRTIPDQLISLECGGRVLTRANRISQRS